MKAGDIAEVAIWMTGTETPEHLHHWKTVICRTIAEEAERQHHVTLGPWTFAEKRPGEDRVPPVPDHVHGPDVRLLVAEAKIGPGRPVILKESGFVADLDKNDLERLRIITRRVHARKAPGDRLSDRHCDQIIEALGPETAVKTLSDDRIARRRHLH